jgi:ANTAR domain
VVIEQAKGVISERAGVDLAEAFTRLRCYARNGNLRLTDVAVGGTLDPLAWAPPAVRPPPDGLSAPAQVKVAALRAAPDLARAGAVTLPGRPGAPAARGDGGSGPGEHLGCYQGFRR